MKNFITMLLAITLVAYEWFSNLSALFRGSLLELLVAIPSHVIVSRRPGCFVGMFTGLGVSSGITVMLWAFGPGIILLFLRNKHRRESRQKIQQKDRGASSENEL